MTLSGCLFDQPLGFPALIVGGKRAQVFAAVEQSFDRRLVADADDQGVGQLAFEQAQQGGSGVVVELVGGFVEKQDVGAGDQGAGEADALLFAAGEGFVPVFFAVQALFQTAEADFFKGGGNGGVLLAALGRGWVADEVGESVLRQVGALRQEQAARALDAEPA